MADLDAILEHLGADATPDLITAEFLGMDAQQVEERLDYMSPESDNAELAAAIVEWTVRHA